MTKNYDKALRRITTILSRLYQGDKLKAKELTDEFNVSLRTIQRDFSERLINFPVYYDHKEKYWAMQDDFKLEKNISV